MNKENGRTVTQPQVIRLDMPIHEKYDDFLVRFESAVPMFNRAHAVELVNRKAPWSEIVSDVHASAPYNFLLYWKLDIAPMMSLAGNKRRATEYMIGNHVIAETMYRHDPAVGLNVPLRCLIYEGDRETHFAIEQPSSLLSSLGRDEINQVGIELDRKLAMLLGHLGVDPPAILRG